MKTITAIEEKQKKPFYSKIKKEKVHQDLLEIVSDFDVLPKEKQEYLIKLWLKSYDHGTKVVKEDSFTNNKLVTTQELKTRFYQYPDIKESKLDFIKRVADKDERTLNLILAESASQDDFIYETYESNYIDKSLDVLSTMAIPKDFEKIDISLVCQDAFAEGTMQKIDYLAKNTLSSLAIRKIKEMQ
jgi:hypothetical protein